MRLSLLPALLGLLACSQDDAPKAPPAPPVSPIAAPTIPGAAGASTGGTLAAGGPFPSLLLTEAWFEQVDGKPKPGPARMEIWQETPDGWTRSRLQDPESNVFHKAVQYDGGIITIGAEQAMVKKWTYADGAWSSKLLWKRSWGGKFDRIRDLEIGDVDGDGKDELVVATHDAGVVAVIEPEEADGTGKGVTELDQLADTFVHEIEIGDVDGDGKNEFFATPSERNRANESQAGKVVMYKYQGGKYVRTVVEEEAGTHAKEILATDIDGDGKSEFFSVFEAATDANKNVIRPVTIRQYALGKDGSFTHTDIATIDDRQTRFLVPGDFDGDGRQELVAAAMKTGLWYLDSADGKTWTKTLIDANSGGFEHACYAADLDGNGSLDLYVASDDQHELRVYSFDKDTKTWSKQVIGSLDPTTITWNITTAQL